MSNNQNRDKYIKAAMDAQTNLNVFASLVLILEGGAIHGVTPAAARTIIRICKAEQQR